MALSSSAWRRNLIASTAPGILTAAAGVASTSSCCSVPTCSPTAQTPTWPVGRWPVPAASSPSTLLTESCQQADVVLPAAAFGEKDGTTTNLEGGSRRSAAEGHSPGTSRPDWMIAVELAERLGP